MSQTLPIPVSVPEGAFAPGTVVGGRYVVIREIGAGATGAVYEVHDGVLPERRLALKILHTAATTAAEYESQREELRAMVQVRHPSIIALYDHGLHDGRLYSVLPLMRGESLDGRVFPRREVRRIGVMLAQALAAMHEVGLTHQDVKPENARLTIFDGVPKPVPILLDLGTAVRVGSPLRGFSPAYLAPEIAETLLRNQQRPLADPKADVYSLAATLRTLLEPPPDEDANHLLAFLAQRAEGAVPSFSNPRLRWLDRHFARWMARDPERRPTAAEFAVELDVLLRPERALRRLGEGALVAALIGAVSLAAYAQVRKARLQATAEREHAALLATERQAAQQRANQAENQLGQTRGQLSDASSRVDALTLDATRLMAEANKETGRAETLEARMRRLQKSMAELEALMTRVRAALDEERRLRESYATQVRERESQLSSALELQRQTEAARRSAATEAESLSGQLQASESARRQLLADLDGARSDLARQRADLEAQLGAVRASLVDAQAAAAQRADELDQCKQRLAGCSSGGSSGGSGSPGGGASPLDTGVSIPTP